MGASCERCVHVALLGHSNGMPLLLSHYDKSLLTTVQPLLPTVSRCWPFISHGYTIDFQWNYHEFTMDLP